MLTPSSQEHPNRHVRRRLLFALVVAGVQLGSHLMILALWRLGASQWFASSEILPLVVVPALLPLAGIEMAKKLSGVGLTPARVVKTWVLVGLVSFLFLVFLAACGELHAPFWIVAFVLASYGVFVFAAAWPGEVSIEAPLPEPQ
jgi:hypothetical protein